MAELQPPDITITADPPPTTATTTTSASSPAPPPPPLPPPAPPPALEIPTTAPITNAVNLVPSLAPKRQRRPSVRLGEIGDQSFDHSNSSSRRPKTWRFHKYPSLATKSSKTRPLTNLVNGGGDDAYTHTHTHTHEPLDNNDDNTNFGFDFGSKKTKSKKPTKRVRTNWASSAAAAAAAAAKFEANGAGIPEHDSVFRDESHDNDEFRHFKAEGSESPIKHHSPVHSMDNQNMGLLFWDRRAVRARLSHSESLDRHENNLNFDNTINGTHNEMMSGEENRSNGVRDWLIGLGLGRYAPVFEIHEVDEEVLPLLTLEDLKDMGINAVGSRRKMYSAILKQRKGFS